MKIVFISDAHGNAVALRTSLTAIDRLHVDSIHFLGDAVGYLPAERECLELLARRRISCQQGNHEAMLLDPSLSTPNGESVYRLGQARRRLDTGLLARIQAWPTRRELEVDGRTVLLVHGSPADPLFGYVYPDTDLRAFPEVGYDAVIMGHTHRPFVRTAGTGTLFVNAGSVGLPRDVGNLAAFATYDTTTNTASIHRVAFDVADAIADAEDLPTETLGCLHRTTPEFEGEILQ